MLNKSELFIVPPSRRQGVVEVFGQFVKVEHKARLVTVSVTTELDANALIQLLNADPDATVGQKEGTTGAEHHQQATEPDHPNAGVFSNLQAGVVALR